MEVHARYKNERGKFYQHSHVAEGKVLYKNLLEEKESRRKFHYQISDPKTTGYIHWGPLLYGPIKTGKKRIYDDEAETEIEVEFVQAGGEAFFTFEKDDAIYSNYDLYTKYLRLFEKVEKIKEKEIDLEGYPLDEMTKKDLILLMKNRGLKIGQGLRQGLGQGQSREEMISLLEEDYEKRRAIEHPGWKSDRYFQYKEEMAEDTNYCVPVAIATITGKPIREINRAMLEIGIREKGTGVSTKDSFRFIRYMGYKLVDRTDAFFALKGSNVTLYDLFDPAFTSFFKSNRKYIVSSYSEKEDQGHASAVLKGELYELHNTQLQSFFIISVYEIVLNK